MVLKKPIARLFCLLSIYPLAFPLDLHPLYASEKAPNPSLTSEAGTGVLGIAGYYAKKYHGKRTHSGAIHHRQKMTAAHPTLPHGAKVKVINLANHRSVIVTINDRCNKRKVEFIDLSRGAAHKLGFLGKGTAQVRIIPLTGG